MANPDLTLRYAEHADAIIDIHRPLQSPRAVVLLLHGGFWRARWDRTHTRDAAAALRASGHLVATPEYRRAGAGGGWPATFDDVGTAARRLPELLDRAGVDAGAGPTVLAGHSAGGQLALWLAHEEVPVDRVIALAPVGDLRHAHEHGVGGTALADFLGGPLAEADPAQRFARRPPVPRSRATAAPGDAGTPRPVIVLHGTDDEEVPVANSRWAAALAWVELRVLPGVGHYDFIRPGTPGWTHLTAALAEASA